MVQGFGDDLKEQLIRVGELRPLVCQLPQHPHPPDVTREINYSYQPGLYCWSLQQANQYLRHNLYLLNFLLFFFIQLTEMICNLNYIFCDHIGCYGYLLSCNKLSQNLVASNSNWSLYLVALQMDWDQVGVSRRWQLRAQSSERPPKFNV